ncbi:MAG: AbrB/MazE/SpoVT family DNA-binding domain-containing protein [bacterium]|nr:AbrB/MazE/SpoVT family DNA-binding domain-containing protein [bacterium]
MSLVTIKNKYQIVIPAKLRKAAGIEIGDFLKARVEKKGEIIFAAQTIVDREKWAHLPKGVREGLEDVSIGRVSGPFDTADALMRHLKFSARRYRSKKSS